MVRPGVHWGEEGTGPKCRLFPSEVRILGFSRMEPGGGALREETGTKDLDQIRDQAGSMESRYRLTSKSVGKREVANRRVSAVWQGRRRLGAAGIRVTGEMQVSANTKARAAERKSQQAAGSQGQEGLARQREGGGLSSVACWRPEKPQDPGMRAGGGRPRLQACTFLQTAVPTRGSSSSSWVDVGQPGAPWKLADGSGFGFWAGGHSRNPLSDSLWQKLLDVPQPRPGWEQPRPPPVRHGPVPGPSSSAAPRTWAPT